MLHPIGLSVLHNVTIKVYFLFYLYDLIMVGGVVGVEILCVVLLANTSAGLKK